MFAVDGAAANCGEVKPLRIEEADIKSKAGIMQVVYDESRNGVRQDN